MAETADSVIIAIEAQMNTAGVEQGTRVVTGAMSQVEHSATQAEGAVRSSATKIVESHNRMGASGMILQHVVRSTADQFAAGTPIIQIFSQHIAQVGEAAAFSGSSMGRFGAVMAGPWGLAISAGIALLGTLVPKLFETGETVQSLATKLRENAEKADRARQAQELFGRTLPGVEQAIRQETEALRDQNRTLQENQQLTLQRAQAHITELTRQQNTNVGAQAAAGRRVNELRAQLGLDASGTAIPGAIPQDPRIGSQLQSQLRAAEAELQRLVRENARIQADAAAAQAEIIEARIPILEGQATDRVDAATAATDRYTAALGRLRGELRNHQIDEATFQHRLEAAQRQRDHDLEAARETARVERDLVRPAAGGVLSQFGASRAGVPLNGRLIAGRRHEGVDIRGATGDPVVAPEGGIAHVMNAPGGLGLYVEIRADSGARDLLGHLSAARIANGSRVEAGQLVGLIGNSGNAAGGVSHLHWQRQVNGQWVDPMRAVGSSGAAQAAQAAQNQANELAERRVRDEARFREHLAGLNNDILNARRRQVQTEEEAAAADIAAINAQREERDQRIRDEAAERTRRDPSQAVAANIEAGFLLAKSQELAAAQTGVRLAESNQRVEEQRLEIAQRDLSDQESVLQARASLARTALERRDIELRLLALQHQEELLAIQKQRAQGGLSPDQRAQLDRREATANQTYTLGQQNVLRQTQGPLASFLDEIPRTAGEMNEALQHVAVDGLQQLNDGLAQAATRFLHLGGVAGHVLDAIISDLIQIVMRQAELAAFGGAPGGKGGGGFSGFLSSISSMFGGGGGGGGASVPGGDIFTKLVGFADGGMFRVGGNGGTDRNILSINGQPRARVSGDETIAVVPQGKALSFGGGRAAGASQQPVMVELHVTEGEMFGARVRKISEGVSVRVVRAAAPGLVGASVDASLKAVPRRIARLQTDGL